MSRHGSPAELMREIAELTSVDCEKCGQAAIDFDFPFCWMCLRAELARLRAEQIDVHARVDSLLHAGVTDPRTTRRRHAT